MSGAEQTQGLWFWMTFGNHAVSSEHGIVAREEARAFEHLVELIASLRDELDRMRTQSRRDADALVAQARARAEQIVAQSRTQAQEMYRQAQAEGLSLGQTEAAARWHEQRLDAALERCATLQGRREDMARIVVMAVDRMVRPEPPQVRFERALAEVGDLLQGSVAATLSVHPDESAGEKEALVAAARRLGPQSRIEVIADASLAPGACVFESDLGRLDAGLDVQLAALRAMFGRLAEREGAKDGAGAWDDDGMAAAEVRTGDAEPDTGLDDSFRGDDLDGIAAARARSAA